MMIMMMMLSLFNHTGMGSIADKQQHRFSPPMHQSMHPSSSFSIFTKMEHDEGYECRYPSLHIITITIIIIITITIIIIFFHLSIHFPLKFFNVIITMAIIIICIHLFLLYYYHHHHLLLLYQILPFDCRPVVQILEIGLRGGRYYGETRTGGVASHTASTPDA